MTILYWLYKSRTNKNGLNPVMMRISIDGKRVNFSTGIKIEGKNWDSSRQRVKGANAIAEKYNNILLSLTTQAWDVFNESIRLNKSVHPEAIKQSILSEGNQEHSLLEAFDYQINNLKSRVGNDIAPNTVKKYETCKKKVLDFLQVDLKRDDIFLYELSGKFIFQLDAYLRIKQGLKHNAVVKNMQQLKRVIKIALQNEWIDHDPFTGYSTAPKETDRGFLTGDELHTLETLSLGGERLNRVRNLFIFCCYTGLAYADVSKLASSHLIKGVDGNTWIILSRTKSKTQATIPLLPQAQAILDKYASLSVGFNKPLLPVISNQNLNKYLKEIASIAEIHKRVSFHLARHTFATTVTLNRGVDIVSVSKMLGHKNLRTTQIYAKVSMLKIAEDMKKLMEKKQVAT